MTEGTAEARAAGREHRLDDTLTVLENLKGQAPDAWRRAKIVGRWVWIEFAAAPAADVRDVLKRLGFHWNARRECWQHCGGVPSRHTWKDPRATYGEISAETIHGSSMVGDEVATAN